MHTLGDERHQGERARGQLGTRGHAPPQDSGDTPTQGDERVKQSSTRYPLSGRQAQGHEARGWSRARLCQLPHAAQRPRGA